MAENPSLCNKFPIHFDPGQLSTLTAKPKLSGVIGDSTNSFINTFRSSDTNSFSGEAMSSTVGYDSVLCSNSFFC